MRFDAVPALDNIGLQRDRPWAAVQLEEETAGIAEDIAHLVTTPERRRRCATVLTCWLCWLRRTVSISVANSISSLRADCGMSSGHGVGTRGCDK